MLQAGKLFKKIKERFIKWLVTPCIVEPPNESMDTARSLGRAEKWYLKSNFEERIMWLKIKIVMSAIFNELIPFFKQFLTEYGAVVLQIAGTVVMDLATSKLSSEQKREAAYVAIKEELVKKGIEVGSRVINSAIEAQVAKLKAK